MPASDWTDLCQQTIIWEPMVSRDRQGKPSYGAPVTFSPADSQGGRRVFKQVRRSVSAGGNPGGSVVEYVSGSVIWILAIPDIKQDDRVYVLGDTKFPPIVSIDKYPDESGVDMFVKVSLGSAT